MTHLQSTQIHAMMACGVVLLAVTSFALAWQIEDDRRAVATHEELIVTEPIDRKRDFNVPKFATRLDEAELRSPAISEQAGLAKHWEEGGVFRFRLLAMLPQPERGTFYEAWLVGETIISAGHLNPHRPGVWIADFQSSESLYDHTKVLVTKQRASTQTGAGAPEHTMLEGDF